MRFVAAVLWFYVLLSTIDGEPRGGEDNVILNPLVVASQPECMSGFCWSVEDKADWSQVLDLRRKP